MKNRFALVLVALIGAFGLSVSQANAQFDLSWYTIDGGGGTSAGGSFSLSGTIGQHDAGGPMTGGSFSLTGGFWVGGAPAGPSCPPCPADFNQSGGTPDDADVAAFFEAWGNGDACADANGSGGTPDDADVAEFFMLWGAGGC